MGIAIPQVVTEDRASGALVVDGSLRFDSSKSQYLKKTFTATGNRKKNTVSFWVKRSSFGDNYQRIFNCDTGAQALHEIVFNNESSPNQDNLVSEVYIGGQSRIRTNAVLRDTGWYHIVVVYDSLNSTQADRQIIYINGERQSINNSVGVGQIDGMFSSANEHRIGNGRSYQVPFNGSLSQFYFIDGQALGPEEFGYTDPLTNTWRPKKFDSFNNPNNGTTWSNLTTASSGAFEGSLPKTNLFDGIASNANRANLDTVGASIDIDFSSNPINVKNTISIWSGKANLSYSINGGAYVNYSDAQEAYKDIPFTGTLTSLSLKKSDEGAGASAIKIDGYVLLDGATDNSYYLPFDGNSPIGKDQSGNGNDWTPVGFGGSVTLDNPTVSGAIPILNTNDAGTVAKKGVRTDKKTYTVTASGGKYYLDGVLTPTLNFLRGGTYIFDYTGATSHPFKFSTTSDGTHGGGSEYTDGTNTATTNVMKITVPHNAPDTLYYYCSVHSGMGSSINVTTDIFRADPYAWKCVFAVPTLSDVSGDLNATVSSKTVTNNNSVSSSDISNFYTSGAYVKGSNRYLSTANNSDFNLGSDDFTWEMWVYPTASGNTILSRWGETGQTTGSWAITNGGDVYLTSNGNSITQITYTAATQNKWTHLAVVRSGSGSNNIKIYKDGILNATGTFTSSLHQNNLGVLIGNYSAPNNTGTYAFDGYIQDVRVYNGVAKYTEDFIPASTNPDVLPDTPSGITGKTNLAKITEGAVAFSRSPESHLIMPDSNDLAPEGGDFTIETFMYAKSLDNYPVIWDTRESNAGDTNGFFFGIDNTGLLYMYDQSAVRINGGAGAIGVGRWYHVALVRKNNDIKMYRDGVQLGVTYSRPHNFTNKLKFIGDSPNTEVQVWQFNGFYSNWRFTKGQALYDGNFDVPTEPLTATSQGATGSNVKLLACQSPTSVTAATITPGTITTSGSPSATNFNPFTDDINTIRGQETGYATLNPLVLTGGATLSNGNLDIVGSSPYRTTPSTIGIKSGKYYWEYSILYFDGGSTDYHVGICLDNFGDFRDTWVLSTNYGWGYTLQGGLGYAGNSQKNLGSSPRTTGDTIAFAFDADVGEFYIYVNGSVLNSGNPAYTGLTNGPYYPFVTTGTSAGHISCNFGQKPFKFPPPDGFQPLNLSTTQPEKVIARPDQYVKPLIWSGDNTTRKITTGHHPDLVWIKSRDTTAGHRLFDTVRGTIESHRPGGPNPIDTGNQFGAISAYHNDGFTLTPGSYGGYESGDVNMTGRTYLGWSWKAGGGSGATSGEYWIDDKQYADATAAGLNGGSGITLSGASVGTKQGFSILRYTGGASGSTLSHGLSQAPDFFIIKNHSGNTQGSAGPHWYVKHKSVSGGTTGNDSVFLNLTNGQGNNGPHGICRTSGDSLLEFVDGSSTDVNWHTHDSAATYSCYAWHDIPGLQKFGSYVGNTTAGPFVELGFRPAILWIKCITQTWYFAGFDAARNPYNPNDGRFISFNNTNGESSGVHNNIDFLSNGFRIRSTSTNSEPTNLNGQTYIYCAWAEAPSMNLYGAQANAR